MFWYAPQKLRCDTPGGNHNQYFSDTGRFSRWKHTHPRQFHLRKPSSPRPRPPLAHTEAFKNSVASARVLRRVKLPPHGVSARADAPAVYRTAEEQIFKYGLNLNQQTREREHQERWESRSRRRVNNYSNIYTDGETQVFLAAGVQRLEISYLEYVKYKQTCNFSISGASLLVSV